MELPCEPNRVFVDPRWWRFSQRVLQARSIGDRVLVIFDYMEFPNGRPAQNLVAYDLHGDTLHVRDEATRRYFTAVMQYTIALVARVGERFGVNMGEFSGNGQASDKITNERPGVDAAITLSSHIGDHQRGATQAG